jgi:hypothetical protein
MAEVFEEDTVALPKTPKLRGRPKGAAGKKKSLRTPEHTSYREPEKESNRDSAHSSPRKRTRSRNAMVLANPLELPLDEIPEGLTYEWKRFSTVGEEDHFYLAEMRRQGWEPVDPKAHPNWVPKGYDKPHIIRGGLLLMERPEELTKEARAEVRALSLQRMAEAEQRLGRTPSNTLTRNHPDINNRIVKEWGRVVAVEE